MNVQLFNLPLTFARLREDWENLMWQCSEERQEIASVRLTAHEQAMEEGYQSPYTDPDDYNMSWQPLLKRYNTVETETPE